MSGADHQALPGISSYNKTGDVEQTGALVRMVYTGSLILPLLNYHQVL